MAPTDLAPAAALLAVAVTLAAPSVAAAGGGYVGDPGAQASQRAGAFVARADDPTALWHNPAGLARLVGRQLYAGLSLIDFGQRFTRAGRYADGDAPWSGQPYRTVTHAGPPQPVPMLIATVPVGRWTLAAGLLAPAGYGRRDYAATDDRGAPAPQRYDTIAQRGLVALPSIGAGVRLGALRLGARVSWGVASLRSVSAGQGLYVADEDPAYDAVSTLDARDRFVPAAGAGAVLALGGGVELGLAWASPIAVRAQGTARSELGRLIGDPPAPVADADARCAPGGVPGALAACVAFDLPQTATAGLRWRLPGRAAAAPERADVELDARWEDWSAGSNQIVIVDGVDRIDGTRVPTTVNRHGLVDVWSLRLGMSGTRTLGPGWLTVRGGVAWDSAAAPATWRRLDLDGSGRLTLALGLGLRRGRITLDLGGARLISPPHRVTDVVSASDAVRQQPDVQVPLAAPGAQPYHPFNAGVYDSGYWIGSTAVTVAW